jgi:hypothetical protein
LPVIERVNYDGRACLSDRPTIGYDFDTFAADLDVILGMVGRPLVSEGEDRGLDAVLQIEFGEDVADVGLDGLLADYQLAGDLAVPVPPGRPTTTKEALTIESAADTVTDVCGLWSVDHSNDLQLDSRRQHLEKSATAPEQHRNLVNLQLIEHTRVERPLCRIRAVDQHIAPTCSGLRLCHRAGDPICHVRHQWIRHGRRTRRPVTGHEDWDAVVVITAPVIDLFHGIATGENRSGRFDLVEKLLAYSRWISGLHVRPGVRSKPIPLMQPHEAVATGVVRSIIRTSDVPVK